ncbi:hypothetical protein V8D89_007767 [Ganoderma adspersum]
MDHMYTYIPETPTSTFPDWVGVSGSPNVPGQALPTSEDASDSITSFEREIDNVLSLSPVGVEQACYPCQPDTVFDWQSEFYNAPPFESTLDSLLGGVSSSPYTLNGPLSPVSEATLVDSPIVAVLPELKLSPAEGVLVDRHVASSPPLVVDAGFMFQCQPWSTTLPLDIHTTMAQSNYDHQHGDQCWHDQPLSQYDVDTACVVVTGLAAGVDFALASMDQSPSELQQDAVIIGAEQKPVPVMRTKRHRNVANKNSAGDKDNAPRKRKRAKQISTRRFPCTESGCPRIFKRSHNLKVHISSVHRKERQYRCMALGCEHAFSRNFDLKRHFQSKHTDQGSPRKKLKEGDTAVKGRKARLNELVMQGV